MHWHSLFRAEIIALSRASPCINWSAGVPSHPLNHKDGHFCGTELSPSGSYLTLYNPLVTGISQFVLGQVCLVSRVQKGHVFWDCCRL